MNGNKVEQIGIHIRQGRRLYDLLNEYASEGCEICLEGQETGPDRIATACLRESVNYMMDFETDGSSGKVSKIDFTRIASGTEIPLSDSGGGRRNTEGVRDIRAGKDSGKRTAADEGSGDGDHPNVTSYAGWCR